MSWIRESKRTFLESLCMKVLQAGELPRHVAFIMDGNRRYAGKKMLDKIQGHISGFDKLSECLGWCQNLGIKEVTVYAFSIENFKRSQQEVADLMNLTREKFQLFLEEKDKLEKYQVCIRVLGNLTLLPVDIQQLLAKVIQETQGYNRAVLNICLAYTSREEMCTSVKEMVEGVKSNIIKKNDISENLLERCLYTATNQSFEPNPVDLLIRTSGEVRLSDFLLWQTSYAVLSFHKVLWPEFNIWNLFAAIVYYQRNCSTTKREYEIHKEHVEKLQLDADIEDILSLRNNEGNNNVSSEELKQFRLERDNRIQRFLCHLQAKRKNFIQNLVDGQTEQKSIIPLIA